MLDAETVLTQAWQGYSSPAWQVFHAKRTPAVLVGCVYAFFASFFVLFFAILAILVSAVAFGVSYSQTLAGGQPPFRSILAASEQFRPILTGAVIAYITLTCLLGALRALRESRDPQPLLIVLPIGFVEYISARKPITVIAFANLTDLRLHVQTTRTTRDNAPDNPASSSYTTASTAVWLDLFHRNGAKSRWRPRARFGRPTDIIQSVIAAHVQFTTIYGYDQRPSQ